LRIFNKKPILILGGTLEAAQLAERLHERGHDVITSLAGRTREPAPLKGRIRIGGFGGVEGLVRYIMDTKIYMLIDMTHPFAHIISHNARHAAEITRIKYRLCQRPPWQQVAGDQWHHVPSIEAAVEAIAPNVRVLLALGRQYIAPFQRRDDVSYLIRMVSLPEDLHLPANCQIILAKPGTVEEEQNLLRTHNITHIICRNSGGTRAYTKIQAARVMNISIIMIDQHKKNLFDFSNRQK
jgi:precorrin-6A/cobalt-precorrin-6A reductase